MVVTRGPVTIGDAPPTTAAGAMATVATATTGIATETTRIIPTTTIPPREGGVAGTGATRRTTIGTSPPVGRERAPATAAAGIAQGPSPVRTTRTKRGRGCERGIETDERVAPPPASTRRRRRRRSEGGAALETGTVLERTRRASQLRASSSARWGR